MKHLPYSWASWQMTKPVVELGCCSFLCPFIYSLNKYLQSTDEVLLPDCSTVGCNHSFGRHNQLCGLVKVKADKGGNQRDYRIIDSPDPEKGRGGR